jgi:dual specificity MAP kinase phosphatase
MANARREVLKLSFRRSFSDPSGEGTDKDGPVSPPMRYCLGISSTSLPTSPSSDEISLQKILVMKKTNIISCDSLANRIDGGDKFLLLDCRPFLAFNKSHIKGALNLNCADRIIRKRLQTGRATIADLATTSEGKEALRNKETKDVVVYDETVPDLEKLSSTSTLFLVLSALISDNKNPIVLTGKE